MTEAITKYLAILKTAAGVRLVKAKVDSENFASLKLLKVLGFTRHGSEVAEDKVLLYLYSKRLSD